MTRIKLSDILEHLELMFDEMHAFLDTQTGEVFSLTTDDIRAAESADWDDEDDFDDELDDGFLDRNDLGGIDTDDDSDDGSNDDSTAAKADTKSDNSSADKPHDPFAGKADWERENIEKAIAVMGAATGRFLPLPGRDEINEWDMMRDFAEGQENEDHAEALCRAIQGRGAFRYFKDRIHDLNLADAWYAFRADQYRKIALDWCDHNNLDVDPNA